MGYFPITPSTEVAENLSKMQADGEHEIVMIAGDGEHGAAGICYGAALGGGRVLNATSSQGLLYSLEQLPVQAGTRVPMVLNIAARAVSGPLDIRGDHSDIYYALNTGWIVLCARDPQAVYDMNFAAVKIGEHPDVRLPVIVVYDGFITSHQKRRIQLFDDPEAMREFLGERPDFASPLDTEHPATFGPYMNDPDLINNKVQLSQAMEAARRVIPEVFAELEKMTGRTYPVLDAYRMEDADAALVLLNSAAETAKETADELRAKGQKVGVLSPNVLRPFPAEEFRGALRGVKAATIGDRADSYGAGGGNLSLEVRAAIQIDPRQRHADPVADLRPRRQGFLRRRRRAVLRAGDRGGEIRARRRTLRLPRRHARRARPQRRAPGCRRSRPPTSRAAWRRCIATRRPAGSRSSSSRCGK